MQKREKQIFLVRLSLYFLIGLVIPAIFLIVKFHLFGKVSKVSLGGWEVVFIIFVGVFITSMARAVRKGLPYSFAVQCLTGLYKVVIPLGIATAICWVCKDCMEKLFYMLALLTICELIAVPINPIPAWLNKTKENHEDSRFRDFAEIFWESKEDTK